MGLLFVLIFQLIAIGLLAGFIAVVASLLVYFFGPKEHLKRRILATFLAPFIGLYTFYLSLLVSAIGLSLAYDVDIGIGDGWNVPIAKSSSMMMIDLMDDAWVYCSDGEQVPLVTHLAEDEIMVYGKTESNQSFTVLKENGVCSGLSSGANNLPDGLDYQTVEDFYFAKKWEITGMWFIPILVFAVLISIGLVVLSSMFVMKAFRSTN